MHTLKNKHRLPAARKKFLYPCKHRVPVTEVENPPLVANKNSSVCLAISERCGAMTSTNATMCAQCQLDGEMNEGYVRNWADKMISTAMRNAYHGFHAKEEILNVARVAHQGICDVRAGRNKLRSFLEQMVMLDRLSFDEVEKLIREEMPEINEDELSRESEGTQTGQAKDDATAPRNDRNAESGRAT